MKSKKLFLKELSFLMKEYDFEFLEQLKGRDERYIFKKDNFELGFLSRTSHGDYSCHFYSSINGREVILDIDDEYKKVFKTISDKNYFWKLGRVIKEQLKEKKIFDYRIKCK